jgi:transcriptional regulator with XRE-family HTH domain
MYLMKERTIARVFAENVAYYRKKQGISQYDLAMTSGISRTMISHYEREGMLLPDDRNYLYRILNKMLRKNQLEKINKP